MTLNLGLRYEYFTPLADSDNLIGGWDPTIGLTQVGVNVNSPYNGYHKDFSPRVGVAWDIGGKGKTVIRAGGGIYYVDLVIAAMVDNINLPWQTVGNHFRSHRLQHWGGWDGKAALADLQAVASGTSSLSFSGCLPGSCTSSNLNWTLAGPIFPANQIGSASGFTCGDGLKPWEASRPTHPSPCSVYAWPGTSFHPGWRPYTLGIQRTLTKNYTLEVNYIGDYSGNLAGVRDVNAIDPTNLPARFFPLRKTPPPIQNHCESITHRPFYNQFPYLQYINVCRTATRPTTTRCKRHLPRAAIMGSAIRRLTPTAMPWMTHPKIATSKFRWTT